MSSWTATPVAAQNADPDFSFAFSTFKQTIAESIGVDETLAAFYRARDFEPVWTGPDDIHRARRAALLEAIRMADDHGLPVTRYDAAGLMAQMRGARSGRARAEAEMALTQAYLRFAHDLQSGILDPGKIDSDIKRVLPRRDAQTLLTTLISGDPQAAMRALIPSSPEYSRLMRAKLMLEHRIAHGGWGPAVPERKLEPGQAGNAVVALRNRLTAMGYLRPHLGATYDARMTEAVRSFQADHGLEQDGVAGASTIREINVAPEERLKSVIVAMERERWINLPDGLGERHIKVNLTDFHAEIIDDNKLTFQTRSVIGHQDYDRRTPEFSDEMTHMVINPYWFVPRSIIVGEYLPKLRANPGAVGHLQLIDSRGRVVGRGQSFAGYSARSFPYSMRQPPGPRNALGTVKFMFPNKYNIYLHDTPAKSLFSREVRTYSHGCVRLNDPHDFAYALLAKQQDDPEGYFNRILRSGQNTRVNLDTPIPVHLIYRTAFTRAKGQVNFRRDMYGRDAKIWNALANTGVALRTGQG
ncbi:murein L,D-transpeptidase [Cognatishimia sp. F0-27]|uniref:L,D-transpeptidase family protein n=1 Tax=Cognatishimia sp. F0-27 TaxID=2816855 RepID=UPI001D0C5F51|nr:L,D-transpeptidase family protein [Cognatishimia sp. F0-27]MCC1492365.1 L,D-transpeptidase family protein [Cognatishimia sp. F0-27]